MNNQHSLNHISETYYGTWEKLLELIHQKLDFYLRIPFFSELVKDCGLHPIFMLDATHPAYSSDKIAALCLRTYAPAEPMDSALDRCITDQLHRQLSSLERADRSRVKTEEGTWEMYSLDDLLRLAWRNRDRQLAIPFYLRKTGQNRLSDSFLLEVKQGCIRLTECTRRRLYETDTQDTDFEPFCHQMYHFFQLATEDYGCYIPAFVWLRSNNTGKE